MSSSTFLVTGATGHQGGATARALLQAGAKVHCLVRDASKPASQELKSLGAVLFEGDFANVEVINNATEGVKGIFLNPFPDHGNPDGEANIVQRFVNAARQAGTVDTLVISTATWAKFHADWLAEDPNYPLKDFIASKANAENAVRNAGFKYYTILRPPWLMHNYTPPVCNIHYAEYPTTGELTTALDIDKPIAHLDARDIGKFAAAALLDPARFNGKEINLGVANVSTREVAREVEKVTGVTVPVRHVEPSSLMKDPSNRLSMGRAIAAQWVNLKGLEQTKEDFELQNSFGIELFSVSQALEDQKDSLFTTLRK